MMRLLAVVAAITALAVACQRGSGPTLTVVIADYSKDHTRPFWQALAEQCLAEYNLDGWTAPDLITPRDVNRFLQKDP